MRQHRGDFNTVIRKIFMRALIQRVTSASVKVNEKIIGEIQHGILALIGIEKTDTEKNADRLLERILTYRIFEDNNGKMNLSVKDVQGGLLLVSQFTLVAETHTGTRPGFSTGMPPEESKKLFSYLTALAKEKYSITATGEFGAYMQVSLCNDGPVTFLLTN
jgi:D-tyrosyl-tRNA(Tyr) deacylase